MAHQKKSGLGWILFAAGFVGIVVAAGIVLYAFSGPEPKPVIATAAVKRQDPVAAVGKVLVPDGQGNCHQYAYVNSTGKSAYEGTVACDPTNTRPKEGRAALPPALRGMQDNLKR